MSNQQNSTHMDVSPSKKTTFSKSFSILLNLGLFLTGLLGMTGVLYLCYGVYKEIWTQVGLNVFINQCSYYLTNLILFVTFCSVKHTKKPFSSCITNGMTVISIMFFVISIVAPRLSPYELSGFEILSNGSSVLIDGYYFGIGLVGIIFSGILKYGYELQQEVDLTV